MENLVRFLLWIGAAGLLIGAVRAWRRGEIAAPEGPNIRAEERPGDFRFELFLAFLVAAILIVALVLTAAAREPGHVSGVALVVIFAPPLLRSLRDGRISAPYAPFSRRTEPFGYWIRIALFAAVTGVFVADSLLRA